MAVPQSYRKKRYVMEHSQFFLIAEDSETRLEIIVYLESVYVIIVIHQESTDSSTL